MENINKGHIRLSRKFFENFLWEEKRVFSKAEAWLWLIANARYQKEPGKMLIKNKIITWERGQLPASIRYLASAFSWSKRGTETFLELLKSEGMITIDNLQGQNIITLVNYDNYNPISWDSREDSREDSQPIADKDFTEKGGTQESHDLGHPCFEDVQKRGQTGDAGEDSREDSREDSQPIADKDFTDKSGTVERTAERTDVEAKRGQKRDTQGTKQKERKKENKRNKKEEAPDFIKQILFLFCEEYEKNRGTPFEIINEEKERKHIGMLLAKMKKKLPDANSQTMFEEFRKLFVVALSITEKQDKWIYTRCSPTIIATNINEIKILMRKNVHATTEQVSQGFAKAFEYLQQQEST